MKQNIFIIGATGNVGKTLVQQIFEEGDTDSRKHQNPTRVVGLASSKEFIFDQGGIDGVDAIDFSKKRFSGDKYSNLSELITSANQSGFGEDRELVFVDATASNDIAAFHKSVVDNPMLAMVTANKNPIAMTPFAFFKELTVKVDSYGYRCSVMAGAGAVTFIQEQRDLNDLPLEISGCFSGTLGYVCTELEKKRPLSQIIGEAREMGYTEPHPRDDLNGIDVTRKLLILARTAGYPVEMNNIKIDPFIPNEYLNDNDVQGFLARLPELDAEYIRRVESANQRNSVLRYVASLTSNARIDDLNLSLNVGLLEVPKDSPLGLLKGTSNKITIVTRVNPAEAPYIIQARGAGLDVTALNVRKDLLYRITDRRLA